MLAFLSWVYSCLQPKNGFLRVMLVVVGFSRDQNGPPNGPNGHVPAGRNFCKLQLQRARALIDLGRPQAALLEVEKALTETPSNPDALQLHGLCLLHLGQLQAAQQSLHTAIAAQPEDAHSHYLLGYARGEAKQHLEAEKCLREALRLSPQEPVYLRALAELLVEIHKSLGARPGSINDMDGGLERLPEALQLARKAVEHGPQRAANHITLGFVSSASGDRIAARACYQQALSIEPNNALAWNNLGCVDLAQGRPMQARERFREALRLNPEGTVARDNLKLVQTSKRPSAIYKEYEAFERQLVLEIWDNVLFYRTGRAEHAARAAARAARTPPIGPPQSPRQFWQNYFFPTPPTDDPRLHAAALIWATELRTLPLLLIKMPQILVWLGASLGLLRLGPAGIAIALSSNAATYLFSRKPLRRRYEHYREEMTRIAASWHKLQEIWLRGDIERRQRDAGIDLLLDNFSKYSEALRERLHAEEHPE